MNDSNKELRYYLCLQRVLGAGSDKSTVILESFGGPEHFFHVGIEKVGQTGLLSVKESERYRQFDLEYADKILQICEKNGIKVMTYSDKLYPDRLRNIPAPPLVLFYKGEFPDVDNEPTFCLVGPRKISPFGARSAYALAKRLTQAGMTLVTGEAIGGDTAVLNGTLSFGGKPIMVLPCGILCDYLPVSRALREKVSVVGSLLSEYPPYENLKRYHFEQRNRLLSGLALGVGIVESDEVIGTLITARHASDQGRDVFVIPGNPTLPQYKGSNALLRDGAKPITSATDILEEYIGNFPDKIDLVRAYQKTDGSGKKQKIQKKSDKSLSNEAKIVYNYLDKQKFTVDDCIGTGLSGSQLLSALTELEFEGFITALPGGFYSIS